jgi:transposase
MLHRTRHLFIRQQTAVINAIRAHLAEVGIVAPVGRNGVGQLLDVAADATDNRLPEMARACVLALGAQLRTLKAQILNMRACAASQPLRCIAVVSAARSFSASARAARISGAHASQASMYSSRRLSNR